MQLPRLLKSRGNLDCITTSWSPKQIVLAAVIQNFVQCMKLILYKTDPVWPVRRVPVHHVHRQQSTAS